MKLKKRIFSKAGTPYPKLEEVTADLALETPQRDGVCRITSKLINGKRWLEADSNIS